MSMYKDMMKQFYGMTDRMNALQQSSEFGLGQYNPILLGLTGEFAKGVTETERQKMYSQRLAPINQLIPDARTRRQMAMASAGVAPSSSMAQKTYRDDTLAEAKARSEGIADVDAMLSQKDLQMKSTAANLAQGQLANLRGFLANLYGTESAGVGKMAELGLQYDMSKGSWWKSLLGSAIGIGTTFATGGLNQLFGMGMGAAGGGE